MSQALKLALEWRAARQHRLEKQKEVDELEKAEKVLKEKVISLLGKSKNKAVSDGTRLFKLETKIEPAVEDWPGLYDHIRATGQFELLYRRVNTASVKERWELGEEVPGVGKLPVEALSDTKA